MSVKHGNFELLLSGNNNKKFSALDHLVEELNADKRQSAQRLLNHKGSEDFLWALVKMVSHKELRVASNAAYAIGSIAEMTNGFNRVLSLGRKDGELLKDLTSLLQCDEDETIMNAAGTLGTLAENTSGREWMVSHDCIDTMIEQIAVLLLSDNQWTASNAALVLARLTISEAGCEAVLHHNRVEYILTRLIHSLGNDPAGRGMNAAFAIGRLLDTEKGKEMLSRNQHAEKMITSLCSMLCKPDMGSAKNACFAVSCYARDAHGHSRVMANSLFGEVMSNLVGLLNCSDLEAAWFAAMTLRTIGGQKRGILALRANNQLEQSLLKLQESSTTTVDLREEVNQILRLLQPLETPLTPVLREVTPWTVTVSWDKVSSRCGLEISYKLFCGTRVVYRGKDALYKAENLSPYTCYEFQLQTCMGGDCSSPSDKLLVRTGESPPSAVVNLHVIGTTSTQAKVSWSPPQLLNGILKSYQVSIGDKPVDSTMETIHIFSRLSPATHYTVTVVAVNSKGSSEKSTVEIKTDETGGHAPAKPNLTVIGRNEIHASWEPPDALIGRFFRYELSINNRVFYQGTDKVYKATGLTPDTEYVFVVTAITSEGRCESEPSKKRTQKDTKTTDPGHHALKTQSFIAKEFQMQDKAKTQPSIVLQKKHKRVSKRPSSSISSTTHNSEGSALTDGLWGSAKNDTGSPEHQYENARPDMSAVIGSFSRNTTPKHSRKPSSKISYESRSERDSRTEQASAKISVQPEPDDENIAPLRLNYTKSKARSSLFLKERSILRPNQTLKNQESKKNDNKNHEKENVMMKLNLPLKHDSNSLSYYSDITSPLDYLDTLESLLNKQRHRKFGSLDSLNAEPPTHRSLDSLMDSARVSKILHDYGSSNEEEEKQIIKDKIVSHLKYSRSKKNQRSNTPKRKFNIAVVNGYTDDLSSSLQTFKQPTKLLPLRTPAKGTARHTVSDIPKPTSETNQPSMWHPGHKKDYVRPATKPFSKFVGVHRPSKRQDSSHLTAAEFWTPASYQQKHNFISFDFQGPAIPTSSSVHSNKKSTRPQVMFKRTANESAFNQQKPMSKQETRSHLNYQKHKLKRLKSLPGNSFINFSDEKSSKPSAKSSETSSKSSDNFEHNFTLSPLHDEHYHPSSNRPRESTSPALHLLSQNRQLALR